MKVGDLQRKPPKILMYGPPGSWKTSTALTVGEGALVLDLDNGLMTALTHQDQFTEDRKSVDVVQFRDERAGRPQAFKKCKDYIKKLAGQKPEELPSCLVIDSLTAMSDYCVDHVMVNNGKAIDSAPEIQHWGAVFRELGYVMKHIYAMQIPVVLIAHDSLNQIDENTTQIELAVHGKKMPAQIQQYFDDIWYMKMKPEGQNKFDCKIQTIKDSVITARSRNGLKNGTSAGLGMKKLFKEMGYEYKPKTEQIDKETGEVKDA